MKQITNAEIAKNLRATYAQWKNSKTKNKAGFFVVYNDFKDYGLLKHISGGALKCYIFLGIVSKNDSGECWYTVESIANYFEVSQRTVSNWLKELEKNNLIKKLQFHPDEPAHTFLKPY